MGVGYIITAWSLYQQFYDIMPGTAEAGKRENESLASVGRYVVFV